MMRPGKRGAGLSVVCLVVATVLCIAQTQIAQDVHITSTEHGDIQIEESVTRLIDANSGQVVDTYSYTVTNISFAVNGGGICWFAIPNPQALATASVPAQAPAGWSFTPAGTGSGAAQGWQWSAPSSSQAIAVSSSAIFGFSVLGPTADVPRMGKIGWCNTPSPTSVGATTAGPSAIGYPDIVLDQGVEAWCSCDGNTCTMTAFALVYNNGPADVPLTQDFSVLLTSPYGNQSTIVTGGLDAGQQVPLIWSWSFTCPTSGTCSCPNAWGVAVEADSGHSITESDETNNAVGLQICCDPIARPNLKVLIVDEPTCLCDGNGNVKYSTNVEIWNTGTANLPSGSPGFSVLVQWPFSNDYDFFVFEGGLPAGGHISLPFSRTIILLGGHCSGGLPVAAAVDDLGQVTECDEGDNTAKREVSCTSVPFLLSGRVFSCGENGSGQLGLGDYSLSEGFVDLANVVAMAAGSEHSVFLLGDGTVFACGDNSFGQLGIGAPGSTPVPMPVQLDHVVAVSAGAAHTLFLLENGDVYACGLNDRGQLGLGGFSSYPVYEPRQVQSIYGAQAISAGAYHSLVRLSDGSVLAFGANDKGQLGLGSSAPTSVDSPNCIQGLSHILAISAGESHSLFLRADATVYACGSNSNGQLGLGASYATADFPQLVNGKCSNPNGTGGKALQARAIAAGDCYSLVVLDSTYKRHHRVFAFGSNSNGQLGLGTIFDYLKPEGMGVATVTGPVTAIAAGRSHSIILTAAAAYGFGWTPSWQPWLGVGGLQTTPVQVTTPSDIIAVACGLGYTLFLVSE
jgi:alpha-tubulin suppressor-like RCC1 family protein